MVLAFAFFIFNRLQVTRRQKKVIEKQKQVVEEQKQVVEEQKQTVEEQKKDITDSIRYGKNIQRALLPTIENLKEALPDSFLLFQPKDIVSGDFYWMQHHKNRVYLAVCDCTGHGVPGAFMSMIGSSLLDEAVVEKASLMERLPKQGFCNGPGTHRDGPPKNGQHPPPARRQGKGVVNVRACIGHALECVVQKWSALGFEHRTC